MNNRKNSVFDGLLGDNTVLSGLMVISPVIVCGDTIANALAVIYAFSAITFLSVMINSFIPKKLPYAVKIIIYAIISSLVYIPVKSAASHFFPEVVERLGVYFMLLAVNSLIIVQSEAKFFKMKRGKMMLSLIFYILGFDAVMLIIALMRELLAYGTIYGRIVDADMLISGLGMPFGGFILLGVFCGIYRSIRSAARHENNSGGGDGDVSDS